MVKGSNLKITYKAAIVCSGSFFLVFAFFTVLIYHDASTTTVITNPELAKVLTNTVSPICGVIAIICMVWLFKASQLKQYLIINDIGIEIPSSAISNKTCFIPFSTIKSFQDVRGINAVGGFIRLKKETGITAIFRIAVFPKSEYDNILKILKEKTHL